MSPSIQEDQQTDELAWNEGKWGFAKRATVVRISLDNLSVSIMTCIKGFCVVTLFLLCLNGCKSNGPAQAGEASPSEASSQTLGPPESEIQSDLMAGLKQNIAAYCTKDKAAMLNSVSSIRYKVKKRELSNTVDGYPLVQITGTLYWSYESKASNEDPSAGEDLTVNMTKNPHDNQNHTDKWDFLAMGPWSYMLMFEQDKNCVGFQ